jgi:hypothetical protein
VTAQTAPAFAHGKLADCAQPECRFANPLRPKQQPPWYLLRSPVPLDPEDAVLVHATTGEVALTLPSLATGSSWDSMRD